jgi:hypothetical protein
MSSTEDDASLPTVRLAPPDAELRLIRRLQAFVLKNPVLAKAAFVALVEEGLAFAETPEGRRWRHDLARSALIHRARLLLDLPGLSLLERRSPTNYPSAYLDAIFMAASSIKPEAMIEPLLNASFDGHDE